MVHIEVDSVRAILHIERVAFCSVLIERHPVRLPAYEWFMRRARMLASAFKLEQILMAGTGAMERICHRLSRETRAHLISSIPREAWVLTGRSGHIRSV